MKVGDCIHHEKRFKTITSLPKNIKNETFVVWESKWPNYQMGGCATSLWDEWVTESKEEVAIAKEAKMYVVKKKKRRGITVVRYK